VSKTLGLLFLTRKEGKSGVKWFLEERLVFGEV
jgi:hypothetical protein